MNDTARPNHRMKRPTIRQLLDIRLVAENSPDVICRFDKKFRHLYVNPALEKATGIAVFSFIGKTPHEAGLPTPFADFWIEQLTNVFSTGKELSMEFSFPTPEGKKYFQTLLVPELEGESQAQSILTVTRDITTYKQQAWQKEELIGFVSHELKSPLATLKAFAQLLKKQVTTSKDKTNEAFLDKMNLQLDKMNNLVNDMLDATGIEGGRLHFEREPFNFDALLIDTVEDFLKTSSHQVTIEGRVGKLVFGDTGRINQVLFNLLANAEKYSPDTHSILISISATDSIMQCCITDYGIGIPKQEQKHIFDRFYRVNATHTKGIGLGLYIAKEIVTQLGGTISVKSNPNKGSTFCFTLPLAIG